MPNIQVKVPRAVCKFPGRPDIQQEVRSIRLEIFAKLGRVNGFEMNIVVFKLAPCYGSKKNKKLKGKLIFS